MAVVNLTTQQIIDSLQSNGVFLGNDQFTYSIPGAGAIWPGYDPDSEPFSVSYSVVSSGQADNFRSALDLWDELIAPNFTEVVESGSTIGELRVAFTAMSPGQAGYAYQGSPRPPGSQVGDIWLNSDSTGESFDRGTSDYETLLHEIGHTLGLEHPFEAPVIPAPYDNSRYTVLSYTAPGTRVDFEVVVDGDGQTLHTSYIPVVVSSPMVVDIAAAHAIYGADPSTRTGDTMYSYTEGDPSVYSIYDAGGTDTIDLSGFTRANEVDLREGGYSSIGMFDADAQIAFWTAQFPSFKSAITNRINSEADLYEYTDNLGIAFGTIIENAVGGSAGDTLRGNGVANMLTGNGGADSLSGWEGADTLTGGTGDDTLEGGDGNDTAVFTGNKSDYVVASEGAGLRLTDQRGGSDDGSDLAIEVEFFMFADGTFSSGELLGSNTPPTAVDDAVSTDEDTLVVISVLANDSDPDGGDTLSITGTSDPANGSVAIDGTAIKYTPDADFNGQDTFTYTISDGNGGEDTATVTVTVDPVNDAPQAVDDKSFGIEDQVESASIPNLVANDSDADGDMLTITAVSNATNGTVAIDGNFVRFTPDSGFVGTAGYDYTVSDGKGGTDTGHVTIEFAPANNNDPDAVDDLATTDEDALVVISVLANDSDPDAGDTLSITGTSDPANGSVVIDGTAIKYTPDADFNGQDTFTYTISDGNGGEDTATVTVTVDPVNDAPQAVDDAVSMDEDQPVVTPIANLVANDTDADGDDLTITAVSNPSGGTVAITGNSITFTPTPGFTGTGGYAYTVSDGQGGTDTATVSVTVEPATAEPAQPIRVVAFEDFAGGVGGTGEIFGTNGFQDLTLLGGANDFAFDGSFGRGGDVLRLAGDASAYTAAIVGTGVELTDGTSRYSIPIGQEATYLVFADGVRALRFDAGAGEVLLGSQAIGGTPAPITAPDDGSVLPTGADPAVSSRVVLFADAEAGVDGDYTLFGTNAGAETVRYLGGDVSLDGSFGRGGDEVVLTGAAETHTAYLSGTSLVLVTPEGEVTVPVGTAGMDLDFAGDVRTLAFDVGAGAVLIGEQAITATSAGTAQGLTAEGFA